MHSDMPQFSNADAPTYSPKDGVTVLSKPHEESQMFEDFLTYVTRQERDESFPADSEVRYAQTRQSPSHHRNIALYWWHETNTIAIS